MTKTPALQTTLLTWHEITYRNFQLRNNNQVLAMLFWPNPFGSSAVGETADDPYTFKRTSLFGPFVRVSNARTGDYIATLGKANLSEFDRIKLPSGNTYIFKPIAQGDLVIEDLQGLEVMTLCNDTQHHRQINCVFTNEQHPQADVLLLAMLGLYLIELEYEDELAAYMAGSTILSLS